MSPDTHFQIYLVHNKGGPSEANEHVSNCCEFIGQFHSDLIRIYPFDKKINSFIHSFINNAQ